MNDDAMVAASLLERIARLAKNEEKIGDLYPVQWEVLRYLSKANQFSRTPNAMTKYLDITRGTMSQTIIALERKGYVVRVQSKADKRSVNVELTDEGQGKLENDPLFKFSDSLKTALGKDSSALRQILEKLLSEIIQVNGGKMFGQCKTCRHFKKGKGEVEAHRCGLLDEDLSEGDSELICVEQEAG